MSNSSKYYIIKEVLDKYFAFNFEQSDYAYAAISESIPELLLNKNKDPDDEGYSFWIPILSTYSDNEIFQLEELFKHKIPESFKYFLKQRHFMNLHLGQGVDFFSLLPGKLSILFKQIIETYYWTLLERNYLPFARYNDWGVLCFDANDTSYIEYPIVVLDHDDNYLKPEIYSKDFISMFGQFDKELDEQIIQINKFKENNA